MNNQTRDNLLLMVLIVVLLFVGVGLFVNSNKACDVNIKYDVTVDSNASKPMPNLAEVKLACYKLCVDMKGSDYQSKCFDKCEKL